MRKLAGLRLAFAAAGITITVLLHSFALSQSRHSNAPQASGSASRAQKHSSTSNISFADITRAAGIEFHLTCGGPQKRYIMESICGGIAVLDYDGDGWMDIFLVNGSTLEDLRAGKCHPGKLYRNNRDGTFTDVTAKSGINHCGW